MTREEAIKRINDIRRIYARYVEIVTENENEALDMAIKSLEQELILEKIRAEIEQMDFDFGDFYNHTRTIREMVLEVIDKYRGEENADSN